MSAVELPTWNSAVTAPSPSGWPEHGVVLASVKVWPVDSGASIEVSATANLDGVCARRRRAAMPE